MERQVLWLLLAVTSVSARSCLRCTAVGPVTDLDLPFAESFLSCARPSALLINSADCPDNSVCYLKERFVVSLSGDAVNFSYVERGCIDSQSATREPSVCSAISTEANAAMTIVCTSHCSHFDNCLPQSDSHRLLKQRASRVFGRVHKLLQPNQYLEWAEFKRNVIEMMIPAGLTAVGTLVYYIYARLTHQKLFEDSE